MTPDQQQMMQLQQQLQTIMVQKETLKTEKREIDKALAELEDAEDEELYRSVGMLLIRKDRDTLEEELADEQERLDMKISSLEKKETRLKDKVQQSQDRLAEGLEGDDVAG